MRILNQSSRSVNWRKTSAPLGGKPHSFCIQERIIGSSRRIALSMTPRLLALPGSVPLRSCINGLIKRHDTWRCTDGSLVEDRPLAAVRRDYRHARKRPARLSQHALEWTPLERPLRPPSATGIRSILVYHPSHTLLARLVSHTLTFRILSPS